jgi:gliding motility-associated lipoprotein GldB
MIKKSIYISVIVFLFSSCSFFSNRPDISNIELEKKIYRFDRELFALKEKPDFNSFKKKNYGILNLYINKVIVLGDINTPDYLNYLNQFLNDSTMVKVYDQVEKVYPKMEKYNEEMTQAFRYVKYYFPKKNMPNVFAQISGFNQSVVVAENLIGVSLDKYLGADCEFYPLLRIPQYARKNMEPKRLVQDILLAYGMTEFAYQPKKDNLLSNMVYHGKICYFLQQVMPNLSDADLMKYSDEELKWCENNVSEMWGFIIEQKHLFSTQYRIIKKYINDGPNTSGMPSESPSRTGIWLGYQIVKEYMKNHPRLSLSDLMNENDYDKILRESTFQP